MLRFRQAGNVALVVLVALIASNVYASSLEQDDTEQDSASGVLLDRLSPKHKKTWQAIKEIIYSTDAHQIVLHPMLRTLFEQLETSDHSVYLEFHDSRSACRNIAGTFAIERLDPQGTRHVAVIKLYLRNIERAYSLAEAKVKDGFAPLAGLNKLDRYAEVLAHEMAHAVDILFSHERAKMVDEILRKSEFKKHHVRRNATDIEPEVQRAFKEREALLNELEKPARMAEAVVWRELIESSRKRKH